MPTIKILRDKSSLERASDQMTEYEIPLDPAWEIDRDKLLLGKTLGEGAFGKVVIAEGNGILDESSTITVAVKMLKDGHTDQDMLDLVSEMELMKMIGKHTNVMQLIGCSSQKGDLLVILEYAKHGNLKDYLRQNRPQSGYEQPIGMSAGVNCKTLISYALQIAKGMEYLASRKCIHRDLAARNVLVSEGYVMKIADFGLARDVHNDEYYRKTKNGPVPVKWMAPEALYYRKYTFPSDVWSFGILLWEMMTYGGIPYRALEKIDGLYDMLKEGYRLEQPNGCPPPVYQIMLDCWNFNEGDRPKFSEIVQTIDALLVDTTGDYYLDFNKKAENRENVKCLPTFTNGHSPKIKVVNDHNGADHENASLLINDNNFQANYRNVNKYV